MKHLIKSCPERYGEHITGGAEKVSPLNPRGRSIQMIDGAVLRAVRKSVLENCPRRLSILLSMFYSSKNDISLLYRFHLRKVFIITENINVNRFFFYIWKPRETSRSKIASIIDQQISESRIKLIQYSV